MPPFSDEATLQRVGIIDTHTGGEPTRIVISGGPDLGTGTLLEQKDRFQKEFDEFRSAVVNEPRGSDVMVGALLRPPINPDSIASVIFFNNIGPLNMCGHGTIGVAVAHEYLGRIKSGHYKLDTPVGTVKFELTERNKVTIQNVPAYRYRKNVEIEVDELGKIRGDIAWGGNWFFLVNDHGQELTLSNVEHLRSVTLKIREALKASGITGKDHQEIDHIELFSAPEDPNNDSRNFVLCPGGAYDRSPCGTGTSAKLACLHTDGKLAPGQVFRQESIIGSLFEGSISERDGELIPSITGTAYVNAEATLILDLNDPFRFGIQH